MLILVLKYSFHLGLGKTMSPCVGQSADDRLRAGHQQFVKLCKQHKIRPLPLFWWGSLFFCFVHRGLKLLIKPRQPWAGIFCVPSQRNSFNLKAGNIGTLEVLALIVHLFLGNRCSLTRETFQAWHNVISMELMETEFPCMVGDCWQCVCVCVQALSNYTCLSGFSAKESVILARWLMGITVAIAQANPEDEHAQILDLFGQWSWDIAIAKCFKPRMRAAVFVNAVAIREAVSLKHGLILPKEVRDKLCTANYLFHSALNCHFVRI